MMSSSSILAPSDVWRVSPCGCGCCSIEPVSARPLLGGAFAATSGKGEGDADRGGLGAAEEKKKEEERDGKDETDSADEDSNEEPSSESDG